jgi:hypothetical protein
MRKSENKVLEILVISGHKKQGQGRLHNKERHILYPSPNIINAIKSRGIRLAVRVKSQIHKPKRPPETTMSSSEDNIK